METRQLNIKAEFRATGGAKPKITGLIPYNSPSEDMGFVEILRPGCFDKALKRGNKILSFWSHDQSRPLGNTSTGTLELKEADDGLHVTIWPDPAVSWSADAVRSIKNGDVSGMSFGFTVAADGEKWNGNTREIIEVDELIEVSPVALPAYSSSQAAARQKYNNNFSKGKINMDFTEKREKAFQHFQEAERMAEDPAYRDKFFEHMQQHDELAAQIKTPQFRNVGFNGLVKHYNEPVDKGGYGGLTNDPALDQPAQRSIGGVPVKENRKIEEAFIKAIRYGRHSLEGAENRALQADQDIYGGFLVMPQTLAAEIIQSLRDEVFMRQISRVIPCERADSLGVPALDNDCGDPTWTAEIKTGSEDSTMSFGKRELHPHPLARRIKVSNKLLRSALIEPDQLLRQHLTSVFSEVEENAFLNGTGANQPLGVFTASDDGISTSRDVSTDNEETTIKADGLINALYTLKSQYLKNASWILHRDAVKQIRKLKDGEGNYLWQPGLAADKPDTILSKPFHVSEYAPNTFTTGLYVGIVGDFRFFWIADALLMQIQVLDQLYAETNQTGFIGRKETDAMPVLEEAFVRVKLA